MQFNYPEAISLARLPTPLEFAPRLTQMLGNRNPVYFKRDDLTGGGTSGNKIRKLEFLLAEAKSQGAEVVITAGGVQSNHCRATAAACAKLGLRCHLILRGEPPTPYDANVFLDYLFGAELRFYPREEFIMRKQEVVAETIAEYTRQGLTPYCIPIGGSVATGVWGYIRCFDEICQQIDEITQREPALKNKPWYVVSAVGSGGTLAGLLFAQVLRERPDINIIGINVCDDAEYFINEIRKIAVEFRDKYNIPLEVEKINPRIIEGYVGPGYAMVYDEVLTTIKQVARSEGIILDPVYTGKAFYGLLDQLKQGTFREKAPLIFIHSGGTFSIFAYRNNFS